ncbi:hypothetical protein BURK_016075 [Burkholderia sp. SJ98]|nr:hypothetical protein BURK_016075 [Burkholderia sp. SJ98]
MFREPDDRGAVGARKEAVDDRDGNGWGRRPHEADFVIAAGRRSAERVRSCFIANVQSGADESLDLSD